jgi:hypothetical protein
MSGTTADAATIRAVSAMRTRGLDDVHRLLECASADRIMATCAWWDKQVAANPKVTKALLARRIMDGGIDPADYESSADRYAAQLARFNDYAQRFPEGSVAESHARFQRRAGHLDGWARCDGRLVVFAAVFPHLSVECDGCGLVAAYSLRSLDVLDGAPVVNGRVPRPVAAMVPVVAEDFVPPGSYDETEVPF